MEPFLRENDSLQVLLMGALGALVLLSILRPKIGLSVSAFGMTMLAVHIYADVGPTSWHLTTAAVCLVGGLLCAGLAGLASLLEAKVARQAPQARGAEEPWMDQWDEYPVRARTAAPPYAEPSRWAPASDPRSADPRQPRMQGGSGLAAPANPAAWATGA